MNQQVFFGRLKVNIKGTALCCHGPVVCSPQCNGKMFLIGRYPWCKWSYSLHSCFTVKQFNRDMSLYNVYTYYKLYSHFAHWVSTKLKHIRGSFFRTIDECYKTVLNYHLSGSFEPVHFSYIKHYYFPGYLHTEVGSTRFVIAHHSSGRKSEGKSPCLKVD
jgi:hypothetical protein